MWFFHISPRSRCKPRYFMQLLCGQSPLLNANVICADFWALILIFQRRNQLSIRPSSACRSCEASSLDEVVANIAVSSAYVAIVQVFVTGISAVYRVYKTGPKTLPCRTPAFIKCKGEYSFFVAHKSVSWLSMTLIIQNSTKKHFLILYNKPSWQTRSNACWTSRNDAVQYILLSNTEKISFIILWHWSRVPWPLLNPNWCSGMIANSSKIGNILYWFYEWVIWQADFHVRSLKLNRQPRRISGWSRWASHQIHV